MTRAKTEKVSLGVVLGAHGVRGIVRVKPFTEEPSGVGAYGPVETKDGRRFKIEALNLLKDAVLCRLEGVSDRDAAEAMRGTELFVSRDRLPDIDVDEEGWYIADLIGLKAYDLSGVLVGEVSAVENFGAGDLLEIRLADGHESHFLSFTDANVPEVDLAQGRVVIDPPEGWTLAGERDE